MRRHRAELLPLRIREDHAIILAWRPSAKPAHTIVNTPSAAPGVWGLKLHHLGRATGWRLELVGVKR